MSIDLIRENIDTIKVQSKLYDEIILKYKTLNIYLFSSNINPFIEVFLTFGLIDFVCMGTLRMICKHRIE